MKVLPAMDVIAFLVALAICSSAVAADTTAYPNRPVRLIVPFPPGGGSDLVARMVAQSLSDALNQSVVVDNRAGGNGIIATETVARSGPDGHTLLWGTSTGLVINPLLSSDLSYNVARDFAPISMVAINPFLLVVGNAVPANNFKELIALAKSKPGQLNYSTPGSGSPAHLAMELLNVMTGTKIVHVPYKGAAAALQDIMGGQVQMKFNSMPAVVPLIRSGRIKALAISTAQRSRVMPEIPTIIESGVPGFEVVTWYGLFAPAKTPKQTIVRLNGHIVKIMAEGKMAQRLIDDGAEPRSSTPEGLTTYMREEAERWKKAIKNAPPT